MASNFAKENKEKIGLKREGHSLFDRIKWKGYSKDEVYRLLAKELDVAEPNAHFKQMNTLRELHAAVAALERLLKRLPETAYAAGKKRPAYITQAITSTKIVRLSDRVKVGKTIGKVKIKKPPNPPKKPPKKDYGRNTLSRGEMQAALEQMKRDRVLREEKKLVPSSVVVERRGIMDWVKSLWQ